MSAGRPQEAFDTVRSPTPSLPPSLRERILADAANTPAPRGIWHLPLVLCLGSGGVVLHVIVEGYRDDWQALPPYASWVPFVLAVSTAALTSLVALARGSSMVGPTARTMWVATVTPIFVTASVIVLSLGVTPSPSATAASANFWASTFACDAEAMLIGVPTTLLLVFGQRKLVVGAPVLLGAVAGIAAGSWSHAVLHFACPIPGPAHVILGHAGPVVPLAFLGACAAWAIERARFRKRLRR